VQKAVNRIQSEEETKPSSTPRAPTASSRCRIDLIYGLPHQTVMGFNRTLERVLAMDPDRLSIYNYAHLPSLFKPQRRILAKTCRRPTPSCRSSHWPSAS
jgi:oxygen-independent coproporphyrinogen-3 oxidase